VKADLVGMTNVPECFLAREAQMGYVTLAIVTDYDCWMDDEDRHVSMDEVFKIYGQRIGAVKEIIEAVCKFGLSETPEWIRSAIAHAVLTPDDALSKDQKEMLEVLRA
jgi:5'-methylthioadenosine phosphorylase